MLTETWNDLPNQKLSCPCRWIVRLMQGISNSPSLQTSSTREASVKQNFNITTMNTNHCTTCSKFWRLWVFATTCVRIRAAQISHTSSKSKIAARNCTRDLAWRVRLKQLMLPDIFHDHRHSLCMRHCAKYTLEGCNCLRRCCWWLCLHEICYINFLDSPSDRSSNFHFTKLPHSLTASANF